MKNHSDLTIRVAALIWRFRIGLCAAMAFCYAMTAFVTPAIARGFTTEGISISWPLHIMLAIGRLSESYPVICAASFVLFMAVLLSWAYMWRPQVFRAIKISRDQAAEGMKHWGHTGEGRSAPPSSQLTPQRAIQTVPYFMTIPQNPSHPIDRAIRRSPLIPAIVISLAIITVLLFFIILIPMAEMNYAILGETPPWPIRMLISLSHVFH